MTQHNFYEYKSHGFQRKPNLARKRSNLDRVEADLLQARAAIRKAVNGNQTQDIDYVPTGPMYHKPNLFHRYIIHNICFLS